MNFIQRFLNTKLPVVILEKGIGAKVIKKKDVVIIEVNRGCMGGVRIMEANKNVVNKLKEIAKKVVVKEKKK